MHPARLEGRAQRTPVVLNDEGEAVRVTDAGVRQVGHADGEGDIEALEMGAPLVPNRTDFDSTRDEK